MNLENVPEVKPFEELQREQRELVEILLKRGDLEKESMRINELHRGSKE